MSAHLLTCLLLVPVIATAAPMPAAQRYQQAQTALAAGDMPQYYALAATLQNYVLQPYLQFAYLQKTIQQAQAAEINAFLQKNADLPIAGQLRRDWLLELARRKDWQPFLTFDARRDNGADVGCARASALAASGNETQAVVLAKRLWLVGYDQPSSCATAFNLLQIGGKFPATLIRKRLVLAIRDGNIDLAQYLTTLLSQRQAIARRWLSIYEQPRQLLSIDVAGLGKPSNVASIVTASLVHFARQQPADAHALWIQIAPRFKAYLNDANRHRIERTIATFAAVDGLPQGEQWLAELPAAAGDDTSREWRARAALRNGDWSGVLTAIRVMPPAQRRRAVWRYWEARALLQEGKIARGRALVLPLSKQFSYYGFLAADLVQQAYARGPQPTRPDPEVQQYVAGMRLTRIALALHQVGQVKDAGAAWRALMHRLTPKQRLAAARLAQNQGWAYGTYAAAARSYACGASALTFPLAHWKAVKHAARGNNISPSLVLALMRQESAFQSAVCSSAGACGLMQLMPSTACWISKHSNLGTTFCDRDQLSKPRENINAGSAYLAYLLEHFAHDAVAAIAAYNAGPDNVTQWLEQPALQVDPPRWVATLPFGETRHYIQAVLFNRVVYARRHASTPQGDPRLRLSDLFSAVNEPSTSVVVAAGGN